jgi:hypothetical protein
MVPLTKAEIADIPVSHVEIDGGFCRERDPRKNEGRANMRRRGGWTIMSFWDRSVDVDLNASSNFILEGGYCFGEVVAITKRLFPEVWDRMDFELEFDGWRELKGPK